MIMDLNLQVGLFTQKEVNGKKRKRGSLWYVHVVKDMYSIILNEIEVGRSERVQRETALATVSRLTITVKF